VVPYLLGRYIEGPAMDEQHGVVISDSAKISTSALDSSESGVRREITPSKEVSISTIVSFMIGVLLLLTAALKLYGSSMFTLPSMAWYTTPWVQLAAVEWEILLGLWLLSRNAVIGSWLAAVCTFILLTGISAHRGWIGEATCGCFGAIKASPWQAFTVDVTVLLLLVIGRPRIESLRAELPRSVVQIGCFALGIGASFAGLSAAGIWFTGSPEAALARLRGESITVNPGYLDFGIGQPGSGLEATVEVRNWTDHPVRLLGGTSDCSCVTTTGLPIIIPPRDSVSIPLWLKVRQSQPGLFTREAQLWTDCDSQQTVRFCVGCRVQ
jgi:hypothetical protein